MQKLPGSALFRHVRIHFVNLRLDIPQRCFYRRNPFGVVRGLVEGWRHDFAFPRQARWRF
jgi:hypothetical protein